jgi:topoisomerase IV subunit A
MIMIDRNGRSRCTGNRDHDATETVDHVAPETVIIIDRNAQWKKVADEIKDVRTRFGPKTELGKRRTHFAEAPEHDEAAVEAAMIEREPITIVVSEKGWIRALKGHATDLSGIAFKSDDRLRFALLAETTSKCLVLSNQRAFLHH